jgi:rRNA maturation endonuclease Nob1
MKDISRTASNKETVWVWVCATCRSEQPNTNDDAPCPNCGGLYLAMADKRDKNLEGKYPIA